MKSLEKTLERINELADRRKDLIAELGKIDAELFEALGVSKPNGGKGRPKADREKAHDRAQAIVAGQPRKKGQKICKNCHKPGHIARTCPEGTAGGGSGKRREESSVHGVRHDREPALQDMLKSQRDFRRSLRLRGAPCSAAGERTSFTRSIRRPSFGYARQGIPERTVRTHAQTLTSRGKYGHHELVLSGLPGQPAVGINT